jgi:hypothetical protein
MEVRAESRILLASNLEASLAWSLIQGSGCFSVRHSSTSSYLESIINAPLQACQGSNHEDTEW